MNIVKSRFPLVTFIITCLILTLVLFADVQNRKPNEEVIANLENFGGDASWSANFNDDRILVGYFQNIFAAKVIKQISTNARNSFPRIQYESEAIYSIKGKVNGEVTIDLDSVQGAKLIPGTTYIFAAMHMNGDQNYYVGFHPRMATVVTRNDSLSNEELTMLVLKHPRTYELLNSYPNEIPDPINIENGLTDNAFMSLSAEDKEVVFSKFQDLIPPRSAPEILPPSSAPVANVMNETGGRCIDGKDNDLDGLIDSKDPECAIFFQENNFALCRDHDDNDADSLIDAADPDCIVFYPPQQPPQQPSPTPPAPSTSTPPVPPPAASSTSQL